MGTHVASVSSHVLPYMCEPAIGGKDNSIQTEVSEVGRCPCSGFTHGCRFYKVTVMNVDAFVSAGTKGSKYSVIFYRYTNHGC